MAARNIPGDDPRFIRRHLTPAKDFVVREKVKTDTIDRLSFGDAHPVPSKYADFVIAGFEQADEEGWSYVYYLKNRAGQEAYNFEVANVLSREWPELEQTFVFRRADYVPLDEAPTDGLPPTFGSNYVWTFMGESIGRGEPWMDGLFIVVNRLWRDTRDARKSYTLDAETGAIVTTERRLVAEGTTGAAMNDSGQYTEITPVSELISVATTRQALGLAGQRQNGKATRSWRIRENYSFPPILKTLNITPIYTDPNDFTSAVDSYSWFPVWLAERYNGPCDGTLRETWFAKQPVLTGDANWQKGPDWATGTAYTTSHYRTFDNETYKCAIAHTSGVFATDLAAGKWVVVSPLMPSETPLQPRTIEFHGYELRITNLPACLHNALWIRDSRFFAYYDATTPAYWPATVLGRVSVRPDQGGYLMQEYFYDSPNLNGRSPGLTLDVVSVGASSFVIQWSVQAVSSPIETLTLDVCYNADFVSGFVPGFKAKDITPATNTAPLQYTVTGMPKSRNLYCRVVRDPGGTENTSNTALVACIPQAEISLKVDEVTVTNPATVALSDVILGTAREIVLEITNSGLLPMDNLVATVSGTNWADLTVGTLPTVINPEESAEVTLSYTAAGAGSRSASLSLASSALTNSPWLLNFTATAKTPEINLKVGGTSYASGSTLTVSSVDTGSAGTTTITVENTGDGILEMAVTLLPSVSGEYQLISDPPASVAAGATATFDISFAPTAGGSRTAVLSIVNNDPNGSENPYVVNLTGTGNAVGEIEIQDPDGQVLVDAGSSYYFGTVGSTGETRVKTFTIYNRGAGTLSSLAVAKSGTHQADYTLGSLSATSLSAGESATFTVTVDPSSTGTREAVITVTSSDVDEGTFTFDVTTTGGTGPEIVVEQPAGSALDDGTGLVNFGAVLKDGGTQVKVFTVRNIGQSTMTGLALTVTGTNSADYTAGSLPATTLAVGDSLTFNVTFNPSGLGTRGATLEIASNANNDGGDNVWSVLLEGTGTVANALLTYQAATIVIGQADFDDQVTSPSTTVLSSAVGAALSAGGRLAIVDRSAHVVRIWNTVPTTNGKACDVTLGVQSTSGTSSTRLNGPECVAWSGTDLLVSDGGNNRVLRFANPTSNGQAAANVIGQTTLTAGAGSTARNRLRAPTGLLVTSGGKLYVCDQLNNRVLIWNTVPTTNGVNADLVMGQSNFTNSVSGSASNRFSQPVGIAEGTAGEIYVADLGNNRTVCYSTPPAVSNANGSFVILQSAFGVTTSGTSSTTCKVPVAVAMSSAGVLAIADNQNQAVKLFYAAPTGSGESAHAILGQETFTLSYTWGNVAGTPDAQGLSGPVGVVWDGNDLIVTGGKRAVIFKPA